MIEKYWNRFRLFGVKDSTRLLEQKRTMLLNEISIFLTLSILILYTPMALLDSPRILANIALVSSAALLTAFPLFLNYTHKIHTARWFFSLSNILGIAFIIMFFGERLRVDLSWLLHLSLVIVFFRKNIFRIILFSIATIGFFYSRYYLSLHAPIYEPNIDNIHIYSFIYIQLGITIIVGRYISVSTKIEAELRQSYERLNGKRQQLIENKKAIEARNIELEIANKELEKFAYVASHDLKSPIRNISSFLNLIKRRLKNHDDQDIHEYIEFATNSAYQMNNLIQDILEYSRINSLENREQQNINLNELISGIQENMEEQLKKRNAIIIVDKLPTIFFNPEYIYILFENLIENGILYNESPIPAISVFSKNDGDFIKIIIKDNGMGIADEHKEQVFEMFKRLHTQVKYKGSGIGLAICKKIVEQMKGTIHVEDSKNGGCTFIIRLPI